MATRRLGQRGMTMIELMVALMLLSVALIALAASFPYSMYAVVGGGLQTQATALAQAALEDARRTTFANLPLLSSPKATVPGWTGFEREVLVSDYTPAGSCAASSCRKVEVRVWFTSQQGETQTSLITVFAE